MAGREWKRVRFWEDVWVGTSSLAIQFWDLYMIVNEKSTSIADLWDGNTLNCTFRRCVDRRLADQWDLVVQLASTIEFKEEDDEMVWVFSSSGKYSSQSLYGVINFGGIRQIFTPAIWKILVPPRVHFFLWLLSKNKVLTRDNLVKRQKVDDLSCLFCEESESVNHLFFECVVARQIWRDIADVLNIKIESSYESIAGKWLSQKKFCLVNMVSSAVLWSIWKLRNFFVFQHGSWVGMPMFWSRLVIQLEMWVIHCP